jgi:hypothetical protein
MGHKIARSIQNRVVKEDPVSGFCMYRIWKKGGFGVMQAAFPLAYVEESHLLINSARL